MTNNAAFHIRQARLEDAAALSQLGRETFIQTFGHLYSEKNLKDFLDGSYMPRLQEDEIRFEQNRISLAYMDDMLVGYAKSGPCKLPVEAPPQPAYELHRLYLLPEARGIGAGAALMLDALEFFVSQAAASVFLGVWEENRKAQAFYKRFGFEYYSRYRFMVGEHADEEWILRKKF